MAHSSRSWRGARTPQGKKRVRQSQSRNAILQPRRTAAKTEVKDAVAAAASGDAAATATALSQAASALDRAAKVGAIHPNAAARRKSRLMRKANAALGGQVLLTTGKVQRQVSKASAAKAAKARIAASKATKAKGEQTAAGKARAALSRSTRAAKEAQAAEGTTVEAASATSAPAPKKAAAAKSGTTRSRTTTKASATHDQVVQGLDEQGQVRELTLRGLARRRAAPRAKVPRHATVRPDHGPPHASAERHVVGQDRSSRTCGVRPDRLSRRRTCSVRWTHACDRDRAAGRSPRSPGAAPTPARVRGSAASGRPVRHRDRIGVRSTVSAAGG